MCKCWCRWYILAHSLTWYILSHSRTWFILPYSLTWYILSHSLTCYILSHSFTWNIILSHSFAWYILSHCLAWCSLSHSPNWVFTWMLHRPWPEWYADHSSRCFPHSSDSEFYRKSWIASHQRSSVVFLAIDCGPYPPILTGVASKSPTTYGSTVTFTCPPGYWFSRNVFTQSSRCNSNGAWTPSQMHPCTREEYSMFTAHACSSKVPLRVGCSYTHKG